MKEYKVVAYKGGMGPKKIVENLEQTLNETAAQGWRLVQKEGIVLIFEREK